MVLCIFVLYLYFSLWTLLTEKFVTCSGQGNRSIRFEDVAPLNYDYLTLPKFNGRKVQVGVELNNVIIRSVDENDMSFTVSLVLWQSWADHRLTFPDWSEKYHQILDSDWKDKLWTPNLYFANSVDGKINNIITPNSYFWITMNRRIVFNCRLIVKLICEMDLHNFPHDVQTCGMKIASAIFSSDHLELFWKNSNKYTNEYSSLQQFDIIEAKRVNCAAKVGPFNASCLEGQIILRRRRGYYVINIYIPTVLIVLMSMLTFWIPSESVPARTTLGVTSLLTVITKQYQASMPNVSYIVALNVWISCCIAFVFLSLVEFVIVVYLKAQSKQLNPFESSGADSTLPMILLKVDGTWTTSTLAPKKKKKKISFDPERLDYISRICFPVAFMIFCAVYMVSYIMK